MKLFLREVTRSNKGFTLVELSIVLIIIGLVVGGVLAGQSIIASARIQSQITQIDQMKNAIGAFNLRYTCIPGDCSRAGLFGLGINGNGDGFLNVDWWGATPDENLNFWVHLAQTQTVPFTSDGTSTPGAGLPAAKISKQAFIHAYGASIVGENYLEVGIPNTAEGAFSTLQASQIDKKVDDGIPESGIVRAQGVDEDGIYDNGFPPIPPNTFPMGNAFSMCASGSPPAYDFTLTGQAARCNLVFLIISP